MQSSSHLISILLALTIYNAHISFAFLFADDERYQSLASPNRGDISPSIAAEDVKKSKRLATREVFALKSYRDKSMSLFASNLDEDGRCKFGQKSYWDAMYDGIGDRPAKSYSWYCGYPELKPFWNMLVGPMEGENNIKPNQNETAVLVVGIGNDMTPIEMYDDGWTNMIAFDYSESGVSRAKELFGETRGKAQLLTADARNLPLQSDSFDATLDKGTLDAIYITGKDILLDAVCELTRVMKPNGIFVCISAVIPDDELMEAFECTQSWEAVHNGELSFAPDGEATIDLGANLFSWRKK